VIARVATVRIKSAKQREFLDTLTDYGLATVLHLGGVGIQVFVDLTGHEAIVATLWPTHQNAVAVDGDPLWEDLGEKLDRSLESGSCVRIMARPFGY
jgi:hypothetical protein